MLAHESILHSSILGAVILRCENANKYILILLKRIDFAS